MSPTRPRPRLHSAIAILLTIALGLASRRYAPFLGKYPGDALWALMVYFGWGLLFPDMPAARLAWLALAAAFAVEFSQLYHAPWIDAVRGTTPGHLVLGSGFAWPDLAAYAAGVALGLLGSHLVRRPPAPPS